MVGVRLESGIIWSPHLDTRQTYKCLLQTVLNAAAVVVIYWSRFNAGNSSQHLAEFDTNNNLGGGIQDSDAVQFFMCSTNLAFISPNTTW